MKRKYTFSTIITVCLMVCLLSQNAHARTEWGGAHCYTTTTLAAPSSTAGSIATNGSTNYYAINVTARGLLTVYTTSSIDTYGYLRDSSCNKLDEDDDAGASNNFMISYDVTTPGTYYVNVEHYRNDRTGSYTLVVELITDDHGNNCTDATTVATTSATAGNIERVGDIDYFKVVIPNIGQLTVRTTGTTDTFGRYYNSSCNQQGSNNDSGPGDNFEIQLDVTAGTYYFSVEERGNNNTGTYTLNVQFVSTLTYTITSSVTGGVGGTISPSGATIVSDGGTQSYTMTPSAGNTVNDVKVDGTSVGAVSSYSFTGVSADHSIEVTFQVPAYLCTDISDVPLDTRFRAAPANIMFVLDDSGSMDWEFITTENDGIFWVGGSSHYYIFDNPGDNVYTGQILSTGTDRKTWKTQWAGYNKLYYNPDVEYVPWPTLSNANPDTPRSHPKIAGNTLNLDSSFDTIDTGAVIIDDKNVSQFTKTPNNEPITIDNEDTKFAVVQEPSSNALRLGEYSSEAWNSTYRYTNVNGQYITTWTPSLAAGTYDVYARWHEDSNNSTAVTYTVDQGGSVTTSFTADQTTNGGDWMKIASNISILAGSGTVSMSHNRTSSTDRAVADAVQFIPTGNHWETATSSSAYDEDYYWTPLDTTGTYPTYAAAWVPNLAGNYTIYARWVSGADRSSAVNYVVKHTGGLSPFTVDQTINGGTWRQLGAGAFTLDASSFIALSHTQSAANNTVAVADAIRLVPAATSTITIKNAHYYVWSESENKPYLVVLDGSTSTIKYYAVNELVTGTAGVVEPGELNLVAGFPPADVATSRTYTNERQNFANWYSFYRKRELTATAAISRTISQMQGVYVGINTINHRIQQPVLGIKAGGVDETSTLLNLLYNLNIQANGTPLQTGLRDVGRYYDQDDNIKLNGSAGNDSPFASAADGGACQQAFAITMTDGYYNGGTPSVGNQDAADGATPTYAGAPYADSYSDTLADVAMKFYKEDLCNGLANSIQGNAMDAATHQHMVTYGVSFGVRGNLVSRAENPTTFDYDYNDPLDPDNPVYPTWPNPTSGDQEKIDDLMHAAFNGRGLFLSASNPDELIDSLLEILEDVELRIGSASSVSVNGDELYEEVSTNLRIFQSSYDSENWSGNVQSFGINTLTAVVDTGNPFWQARDEMQSQDYDTGRIISTFNGSSGIPFRYASLPAAMKTMLNANATIAQNTLNYIRGDHSQEVELGGTFRDRIYNLGDIVHSSPSYKHGILYVGGNDGMLHALYAEDDTTNGIEGGKEYFAYVPNLVFENLYKLTSTTYTHEYYVDLTPKVVDVDFLAGATRITTLLVGGLGGGGKGYYALNVSAPDPDDPNHPPTITDETTLAGKVLWEYPDSSTGVITKTITNATNTSPIVISAASHGFSTGDAIEVSGVLGNTAANGEWFITVIDAGSFSLDGSTGNGAYTSGGTATYTESDYLGYTYSMPNILRSNNSGNYIVLFGNGYNSKVGHAALFILDPADGSVIRKIDTGAANAGSPKCNGLSTPVAIDINNDFKVDYVYAGDLQGNLWKFDLTSSDPSDWDSAYKDTSGTPKPLFQAIGPAIGPGGGTVQPITTRPDVMSMKQANQDGYLILFATGRYIGDSDTSNNNTQTIYGIWDYGDDSDDQEYLGSFTRGATPLSNQPSTVSLLEQTEIINVDTYTVGSTTQHEISYTTEVDTVDDVAGTTNNIDMYGNTITADDYKPNPTTHAGWYFDLPISGERVVTDPLVRGGNAIVISYIPDITPCSASGESVINEINAASGARLDESPWDIDENGTFDKPEYDSDGNLVSEGDYLIYNSTAPDSTTARGSVSAHNANPDDYSIVAPSRIKKAGRLMSPAIASLPDGELKIMSSSTANAATQNITTLFEQGPTFGIRYWFEKQE